MSETETPKKVAKTPKKKAAPKPSVHPPVAQMVKAAVAALKDRKGSSLAAIKKYIQANYKGIDMVRLAPFLRRYLKKAVTDGDLVQAKGTGAAGSFKLSEKAKKPAADKPKKPKAAKPKKVKKPKPATPKKAAKKPKADKPKKAAKKPAATKKSPKKSAAKPKKPVAKKPAAKKTAKPKKPAAPKAKKPAAKK
jgi:hypothetical protein